MKNPTWYLRSPYNFPVRLKYQQGRGTHYLSWEHCLQGHGQRSRFGVRRLRLTGQGTLACFLICEMYRFKTLRATAPATECRSL